MIQSPILHFYHYLRWGLTTIESYEEKQEGLLQVMVLIS